LRYTLYPATPTLSVDAAQLSVVELDVVPLAVRPVGADGGVVSPPPPEPGVQVKVATALAGGWLLNVAQRDRAAIDVR